MTTTPATGAVTALLSQTLRQLADGKTDMRPDAGAQSDEKEAGRSTLGALLDALDERAYGLMLLLLALPCCLPFLYGIPQIVALPMLALAGQLAMGRQDPWLPKALSNREFEIAQMQSVVDRAARYVGWLEKLSSHRLAALTYGRGAQIVGALLLIPTASILVPLPSTNTMPGIGVAIAAVGLLERDGLLVLSGLTIGLLWVGLLVFFGAEAVSFIKDMVLSR